MMSRNQSQIVQFYRNQTIFLTGGTGFVGKLLVEKLLRTCWDLKKIYILVRTKRGKTPHERLNEFIDSPCFESIKRKNLTEKLVLIGGDCKCPNLGLSDKDINILTQETTCVIHAAASVRFDNSLKEVSKTIKATRDLIELAKKMQHLKVFVYVSTAYSNCIYSYIKEDFYQSPVKPEDFFKIIDCLNDEQLRKITPILLNKWPNTYVYGKCITEDIIRTASIELPTIIVRPAIITNTAIEPIRGWIEKPAGLIGIIFWGYLGFLQSLYTIRNNNINIVPADYVCNCILVAAWKRTQNNSLSCTIYNNVGQEIDCEYINNMMASNYFEFPTTRYVWNYTFRLRTNKYLHYIFFYLYSIPFYFLDLVSLLLGKSTKFVTTYKKIKEISDQMVYFPRREWKFDTKHVQNLWTELSDIDKKIFRFYGKISNLDRYFQNCILGIRLYLFQDPLETLSVAKTKTKLLIIEHYVFYFVLTIAFYVFYKFLINLFLN